MNKADNVPWTHKHRTVCKAVGNDRDTWAECACGSIFTGNRSIERRNEHVKKQEGNFLDSALGGSSWDKD